MAKKQDVTEQQEDSTSDGDRIPERAVIGASKQEELVSPPTTAAAAGGGDIGRTGDHCSSRQVHRQHHDAAGQLQERQFRERVGLTETFKRSNKSGQTHPISRAAVLAEKIKTPKKGDCPYTLFIGVFR